MTVGIEAMNLYGGETFLEVRELFAARGLDLKRFDNLMMERKSVGLPFEDAVTCAVNAAKPIVDGLTPEARKSIEMVITSSESGVDFGKSLSTYIHDYLGLSKRCRLFEVKQACYAGNAAFQIAVNSVASGVSPGSRVLVIATDVARAQAHMDYGEPSQGVGAVAMLVSREPRVFQVDLGANGMHSYEVMDTCRPAPELETGDPDLSLLSYLQCLEGSFRDYGERVEDVNFATTFDLLAFHTPFGGMVKGAHRKMMRRFLRADAATIEADFAKRLGPSLRYCVQVGNVYSATVFFALCSLIDHAEYDGFRRVGLFSYGSGCSSEFFSGQISPDSKSALATMDIRGHLERRYRLDMPGYEQLLELNRSVPFGIENWSLDISPYRAIYERQFEGRERLILKRIDRYHREYAWS